MTTIRQQPGFEQCVRAILKAKNGAFGGNSNALHDQTVVIAMHIAARSSPEDAVRAIEGAPNLHALIDHLQTLQPRSVAGKAGAEPLAEPARGTEEEAKGGGQSANHVHEAAATDAGTQAGGTPQQRPVQTRISVEVLLTALVESLPQYDADHRLQVKRMVFSVIE